MVKVLLSGFFGFLVGMGYGIYKVVHVPDSAVVRTAIFIKGLIKVMGS